MKAFKLILIAAFFTCSFSSLTGQQSYLIPTNTSQNEFINTYKYILKAADADYRNSASEAVLFDKYSEYSVYWAISGSNAGSFIVPDELPQDYSNLVNSAISSYTWNNGQNLSIQFKKDAKKVGIFKSQYQKNDNSISWETTYFTDLFSSFLGSECYYVFNETECIEGISDITDLIIVPAFTSGSTIATELIDSIADLYGSMAGKLSTFLARGGVIYTEGNAAYLLEALGLLPQNTFDYSSPFQPGASGIIDITTVSGNPLILSAAANANKLYVSSLPTVNIPSASVAARLASDNRPVIFSLEGTSALGGKVICNLGLPLVQGLYDEASKRQTQYSLDAIFYAFSKKVDVTRTVTNHLWGIPMVVPDNTVSFDRVDTFNVTITIRNLSPATASNVSVVENIPSFLKFIGSTAGSYSNNALNINIGSLAGNSEQIITYQLCTPDPRDPGHESIGNSLIGGSFLNAAINTTSCIFNNTNEVYSKNKAYTNSIFSANIVADADVNWKNFLGTYFQPFKVFTIMENKERTAAEQALYVQFIPRDVPFYQTDNSINIPILKTPGGKFIDVLKGVDVGIANKSNAPITNDFDADGDPDVWLDTASIYPKNYSIKDTMVYWANPWNHLRTGADDIVFEDINHDGIIARADSTGAILQDAPGDKIRVWKLTWPIGNFPGYQYYDPYCSYELWIDAPDLIALAAGVGYAFDSVPDEYNGMYFPYTADIETADLTDTTYAHWMEMDGNDVVWKQFIQQKQHNYLGYAFIDTLEENYQLRPYDSLMGTTPVPHNEFIAVVCLGGEEIDMTHYTPKLSLYSNLYYKTLLGEDRITPIRTVYTYYAPLPNPMQFEYLSSSYIITDSLGSQTQTLPKNGIAQLEFNLYPSTEYTYYWIRNFGYPVLNSPLKQYDGLDGLGDGVFGYFIYDIPKGMGGYSITLPRNPDGSYDINALVQVEGNHPYQPLINNPNTPNAIEVWEDPFQYHVYIPQLLIPPALDDNDFDLSDDWWDDKGDRFLSSTGFLNDAFMPGDGDTIASEYTHEDIGYGVVSTGWSHGADVEYGDDLFENLGKIHITINAQYEGFGREGNVDISKGGTFVCEEIFGGSPWVISSHVHSAFAEGTEYEITSSAIPSTVKYGGDTICIKHEISDQDEPHYFNSGFDPYIQSYGYEDASITSIGGGKDPCSFITPDISTHSIIDPAADAVSIVAYPDIPGSTKSVTGAFLSVKVEVSNLSDDNWRDVTLTPILTNAGGATMEVEYVAYPRPLVPNDNIGDMTTGWRFNQPEGEVIVKPGHILYEIQPTRRAYFVFLFRVPAMAQGIYEIGFTLDGDKVHYTGANHGAVSYDIPSIMFSVVDKSDLTFSKLMIGTGVLDSLIVPVDNFVGLGDAKLSAEDVDNTVFDALSKTLPVSHSGSNELIDLTGISTLPNGDTSVLYILQKGIVTVTRGSDSVLVSNPAILNFKDSKGISDTAQSNETRVMPLGPFISITNTLYTINGARVLDTLPKSNGAEFYVVSRLNAVNIGNSPSYLSSITLYTCSGYELLFDSISVNNPYTVTPTEEGLKVEFGTITPGESRQLYVYYKLKETIDGSVDITTLIDQSGIGFDDKFGFPYEYIDPTPLKLYVYEFAVNTISYNNSGDMLVSVTAIAVNYGITAHNVWFRIYPVVNGGLREFPIAEINIETFLASQAITLSGDYLVPAGQTIEFVAVIDDNNEFLELLKSNNEKLQLYDSTSTGLNDANLDGSRVYPNPFNDLVTAEIVFNPDVNQVLFTVYNQNGELMTVKQFPVSNGKADITLNLSHLVSGAYIYKAYAIGHKTQVYSGFIIKH